MRRHFLALVLVTVLTLLFNQSAQAHATIVRIEPDNSVMLEQSPAEIQLWFDETIVPRFSSVRLLDSQDKAVANVSVDAQLSQSGALRIALPTLKKGTYTLFWKTLSDEDGHFSQGILTLNVGVASGVIRPLTETEAPLAVDVEAILRWLNLLLLASAVGALAIAQFVLLPSSSLDSPTQQIAQAILRQRILQWAARCASGALLVGFGLLAWQVWLTEGSGQAEASWWAQSWVVLTQTRWGILWLVKSGILLLLSSGLWFLAARTNQSTPSWLRTLVFGRAFDLLIVQALASHQLSGAGNWLLTLAGVTAHLLAASIWMGGLITLVLVAMPLLRKGTSSKEGREFADWQLICWRSFSGLALSSVGLLVVSGLYSVGQQVASLDALITTAYGKLLMGKLGLVLLAGVCGFFNAVLLHPQMAAPLGRWLSRPLGWTPLARSHFPRLLLTEAAIGVLILGASGFLSAAKPPRELSYTIDLASIQPMRGKRVEEMLVTLEAKPNRLGQNLFNIRAVGNPDSTPAQRVLLNFTFVGDPALQGNLDETIEPVVVAAEEVETGQFQLAGKYLKRAGAWQIDVVVIRNGESNLVASFDWMVAPPGFINEVVWSKRPLAKLLTLIAGITLLLAISGLLGWQWRKRLLPKRLFTSVKNAKLSPT